jgi:peptidoglycan-associated lipoprotein
MAELGLNGIPGLKGNNSTMKSTRFTRTLILGLGLSLTLCACKHKTPPTTRLDKPGTTGTPSGPGPGGQLSGPGGTSTTGGEISGIPLGRDHQGWPEDADKFKSETVFFAFDSSVVQPGEQSKVATVADFLKANGSNALKIEGHCDERGTEEYNRSLGERRALALREELVRLGIDPTRVDTISYGKDRPVDPGHAETAWKKNRRGAFILLTPPK